jgi:hypothetical protein
LANILLLGVVGQLSFLSGALGQLSIPLRWCPFLFGWRLFMLGSFLFQPAGMPSFVPSP